MQLELITLPWQIPNCWGKSSMAFHWGGHESVHKYQQIKYSSAYFACQVNPSLITRPLEK